MALTLSFLFQKDLITAHGKVYKMTNDKHSKILIMQLFNGCRIEDKPCNYGKLTKLIFQKPVNLEMFYLVKVSHFI